MKFDIDAKIKVVKSDNALELKQTLDNWCASIEIISHYTIFYSSFQNDVAKRNIRIIENNTRAMMKKVKLFLEFWVDATKANVYVRNRAFAIESIIDDEFTSFLQMFIEMKSSIDHIRVWECKCYSWQDSKSILKHNKHDKFMDSSKMRMFIEYDENIIKYYDIYISKHRAIEKFKTIIFSKNKSRRNLDQASCQ